LNSDTYRDPVRRAIRAKPTREPASHASMAGGKQRPFRVKFVQPGRDSSSHHHTIKGNSQLQGGASNYRLRVFARSGQNTKATALAVPLPRPTASPILVGDRQTLRALRAAEMAAWEAAGTPGYKPTKEFQKHSIPAPRLPSPARADKDVWGLLVLAGCAAAGLVVGVHDLGSLFAGWARVLEGIRLLIQ